MPGGTQPERHVVTMTRKLAILSSLCTEWTLFFLNVYGTDLGGMTPRYEGVYSRKSWSVVR